jgi:bacteriocin-like protein
MTDLNNEIRELTIDELDAVSGGEGVLGQVLNKCRGIGYIVSEACASGKADGDNFCNM